MIHYFQTQTADLRISLHQEVLESQRRSGLKYRGSDTSAFDEVGARGDARARFSITQNGSIIKWTLRKDKEVSNMCEGTGKGGYIGLSHVSHSRYITFSSVPAL